MSWKGIANAKRVKARPKSKRGGQLAADDGLDYSDSAGMPMLCRSFLEYMAVVNFAPRTIEARGKDLQAFFQWCQERELLRAAGRSEAHAPGQGAKRGRHALSRAWRHT